ncbi:glycosyltransferase [Helicobacter sp.]|uniref:glycosyltransferase n=1 Tax=Helicobacter sp. TaxID=218 RepID=UPI0019CD5B88|nr:glycosyltransferase [Helicobacter sp.]MBD5164683.1 glycosyltransferase [Helicobacter sp.]
MARISVLMAIYNCAPTLDEALESLYTQTYQDFQIIMCDDGSTDDTYKIAQSHAEKHPNIILLKNDKNMGLNYSLNHCLQYADTEYCARMDGDDISLPTRFEAELKFLEEHPDFAIVSTPMIYFDENGEFRRAKGGYAVTNRTTSTGPSFPHAPVLIRTEAYKKVGGYGVAQKLLRVEDVHLWYKLYAAGYRGYVMDEPLYAMRDDRNAIKRRKFKYRVNSFRVRWEWIPKVGLSKWRRVYAFTPLLIGLLPLPIYKILHKRR